MATLTKAEQARIIQTQAQELAQLRAQVSQLEGDKARLEGALDLANRKISKLHDLVSAAEDRAESSTHAIVAAGEGISETPDGDAGEALRQNVRRQLRTRSYRMIWVHRFMRANPSSARAFDEADLVNFIVKTREG